MRKQKLVCLAAALTLVLASFASKASADSILITQFNFGSDPSTAQYNLMRTNLVNAGHTVDLINMSTSGTLASTLSGSTYDQVFLWDVTSTAYLNGDDVAALAGFFTTHNSLVVDTRSYGYYFQGNNASEVALLQNISNEFANRGGGVWVGTDHAPDWTRNGNPFLSAIGVDPITGIYSDPVNNYDPDSVLLAGVTTTDLWAGGASVGRAPLGLMDNGIDMRFHFGHSSPQSGAIAYITASFGDYIAPDEDEGDHGGGDDPTAVPEPATMMLLGSGLLVGALRKRKIS